MAVITELIRKEADGTLSFGNFDFDTKQKKSDFEYEGDLYRDYKAGEKRNVCLRICTRNCGNQYEEYRGSD